MDPPIPANEPQLGSIISNVAVFVSPSALDFTPPSGDATPQAHAFASLTG